MQKALLESGRVANRGLLPLSSKNVILMKTVLSYHHARKMSIPGQKKTTADVPDSYLHFMVPLCAVVTRGDASSRSTRGEGERGVGTGVGVGAASREQKMELNIAELVELFESSLEAGLSDFVDSEVLRGNTDGAGRGGADAVEDAGVGWPTLGSGYASRDKHAAAHAHSPWRVSHGSSGGGGGGKGGCIEFGGGTGEDKPPPAWIDVAYGALVPDLQTLVYHITRAHLGIEVITTVDDQGKTGADDIAQGNTKSAVPQVRKKSHGAITT